MRRSVPVVSVASASACSSPRSRWRSSAAAFSVNVIAAIDVIGTPRRTSPSTRSTSALVLPAPAPASTNKLPSRSVVMRSLAAASGGSSGAAGMCCSSPTSESNDSCSAIGATAVAGIVVGHAVGIGEPTLQTRIVALAIPLVPPLGGSELVGFAVDASRVRAPRRAFGNRRVEAGLDAVDDMLEPDRDLGPDVWRERVPDALVVTGREE